ncbi:MAG: sodium:solute symporter family protein [Thermoprotei archaeon]|jgi:SSS family solute:Na+ symporter
MSGEISILSGVSLVVFIMVMLGLGEYARRKGALKSVEEFYLANRMLNTLQFLFTYFATTYSAFMFIGLVGYSYFYGVGSLGFELTYLMGTAAILSLLSVPIYRKAKKLNVITPTQLIYLENGSKLARYITSISYLVFLIPYMSVQVIGPAVILSILGIPREISILTTILTVFVYVYFGGMRGVVYTDIAQGAYFLLVSLMFVASVFQGLFSTPLQLHTIPGGLSFWTFERFLSLTIPWIFFALTNPQVLQRIYVTSSEKNLTKGTVLFLIAGFTLTIVMVLTGLGGAGLFKLQTKDPNMVTPMIMSSLPISFQLAIALAVWAAALSTFDSILLTLASIIDIDLIGKGSVKLGRWAVLGIIVIVGIFSFYTAAPVVILAVASSAALLYLAPILIVAILRGLSKNEASLLTLLGFVSFTLLFIVRNLVYPHVLDYASLGSLIITSLASIIIWLKTPNSPKD